MLDAEDKKTFREGICPLILGELAGWISKVLDDKAHDLDAVFSEIVREFEYWSDPALMDRLVRALGHKKTDVISQWGSGAQLPSDPDQRKLVLGKIQEYISDTF